MGLIILKIFIYASLCVFVENICSGIWRAFISKDFDTAQKRQFVMWSYLTMLFLYFIFPVPFLLFMNLFSMLSWYWIIMIAYFSGVVFITLIESGYGLILEKILGFCSWGKYTREQGGITWLGGYSRYMISLSFGLMAIAFYYFDMLFNYCIRGN